MAIQDAGDGVGAERRGSIGMVLLVAVLLIAAAAGLMFVGRGQAAKRFRHGRPGLAGVRIDRIVAIAAPVRDPSEPTGVGHGDLHAVAAWSDQVAERRLVLKGGDQAEQT